MTKQYDAIIIGAGAIGAHESTGAVGLVSSWRRGICPTPHPAPSRPPRSRRGRLRLAASASVTSVSDDDY
jgi:hypothetical protein